MTPAGCHPDKPHVAHGLCDRCYQEQYRKDGRPRTRKYKWMPDFDPDWERVIPKPTPGVRQNCVTSFPVSQCPHCHRLDSMAYYGREARCAGVLGGCGHTVFLVKEVNDGMAESASTDRSRTRTSPGGYANSGRYRDLVGARRLIEIV